MAFRKHSAAFVLLMFAAVAAVSCSRQPVVLVLAEDYWWKFLDGDGSFHSRLEQVVRGRGFRLSTEVANRESLKEMLLTLPLDNVKLVLVSPFMFSEAVAKAKERPELNFLVLGRNVAQDRLPGNLWSISFDKGESYRAAGRILGELSAGNGSQGLGQQKCGILALNTAGVYRGEIQAFREGFLEVAGDNLLVVKELEENNDRLKLKRVLLDMKTEGVRFYVLKVFGLTGYCLEILQKEGGMVVLEDWAKAKAHAGLVLFSIESDYIKPVEAALTLTSTNSGKSQDRSIASKAEIIWNPKFLHMKTNR